MTAEEEKVVRALLDEAEGWHCTAYLEGMVDYEWKDEPAVAAVLALLDGKKS